MEEIVISKEELIELFENKKIKDTKNGWFMDGKEIDIFAVHEVDPKFLQDITNAKFYKITPKR